MINAFALSQHHVIDSFMAKFAFAACVIHCVAWSYSVVPQIFPPSLVTCHCCSARCQKHTQETQISLHEKGDTVGKDAETGVTLEGCVVMPVESADVITTHYDTVDQGFVRYSGNG